MTNAQTSKTSQVKHLFSERHARGWIVTTIVILLLMINARALLVVALIGMSGDVKRLATDPWSLYIFDMAMVCIALIAASRRMSGITVKVGEAMAVRLKMTVAPHSGKHSKATRETHKDVQFRTLEDLPAFKAQDDETIP